MRTVSAVGGYLAALARKGWIAVIPSGDRGIRLLREGAPILDAEHLPAVAAGSPTVIEECRNLPRLNDFESFSQQFEAKPDFFVRVERDSLDKVGFTTGDIVAVRHQPEARNGDIVVARIGEEVTLKRYERTGPDTVEFQPESTNPQHKPIRVDANTDDVAIVGVVVGAIIGTRRAPEALSAHCVGEGVGAFGSGVDVRRSLTRPRTSAPFELRPCGPGPMRSRRSTTCSTAIARRRRPSGYNNSSAR